MRPSIRLGRVLGVEIGLHYSWFIIAILILFAVAGHFHTVNPQWGSGVIWILSAITALLFFASIVAHELSHAAVARSRGIPVRSITLFALGGVANVERESPDPKSEFWMAIVGPITSAAIGLVFLALASATGWSPEAGTPASPYSAGLLWLGYINIALAVFNMIPGYPLDGGRVLRSIVWAVNKDMLKATRITAVVGQVVAILFIAVGFYRFFAGAGFGGLWLAFIGWFLAEAAAASHASAKVTATLGGVRVRDVMSADCPTVEANLNLRIFAEEYLLRSGRRCFAVMQDGRRTGMVSIDDLKRIDRARWPFTTLADIAKPVSEVRAVSPDTPLTEALEMMAREDLHQLPVVANGEIAGIVSRGHVLQYMQTQAELKAA
jgi:Zn-dependent protease/CBS domain-containing protein